MDINSTMGMDDFDELESMFGDTDYGFEDMENTVLTQNLEGFASCFPDWDLHPVRK